ncbi:molybdate transport system regulatory protein [Ancylobacter aquaticus]|uniref:Molybdate transport system regulatory protein n=1 Tax=Ancylobacter aquaticus TaxID=100 RepID=A0A4R1I4T7_ANCAQ|nr:LysR family transcriptional regulator [Ancylobacter aquaticus]TCK29041.1 molybdate transport system regulatory protein [Ancylobacter aquaticus]
MAHTKTTDADELTARRPRDGLFIRVYFGDGRHIGPGMIELLETIRSERSILSAARALGMSYRRAWLLVDEIGRSFRQPVVETHPGRRGHGTDLTPFGERLIALYREIEQASAAASRTAVDELRAALAPLEAGVEIL